MRVRWIGLTLALVLLGAAAGYGLRVLVDAEPTTLASAEPVPAESPSYPMNPLVVLPDPDYPALEPGVALHRVELVEPPFELSVPIPRGWVRTDSNPGEWKWYPSWDQSVNGYFIRVRTIANQYQPITKALDQRIAALEDATGVADLRIERQESDGFLASYVSDQHRRVNFEAFLGRDGSDVAYASIAVVGREVDRPGLRDLFDKIVEGART